MHKLIFILVLSFFTVGNTFTNEALTLRQETVIQYKIIKDATDQIYRTPLQYSWVTGDRKIILIAGDGAWTWYNDERVVFWNQHLLAGYVKSNGHTAVSFYPLPGQKCEHKRKERVLSTWAQKDDHNNPALLPLGKDSLLAVYARHGTHNDFNSRVITDKFMLRPEKSFPQEARVTYANLYKLSGENGKIFNFFRGKGWNPNLVTSNDYGNSWSEPIMIFISGDNHTRPYVKYASNNSNRIDLLYTDGHPRNEPQNNVYHVYYESGSFYNSKGGLIRSLDEIKENPLLPSEGTLIYNGASSSGRGWVHDIERDENGVLAGVYISSPDGDEGLDLRYRYARYNPEKKKWSEQEIAFAGSHLYVPENHYAGGICIDPDNLDVLYLSSDVDPDSGEPNGTGKYQIYKGTTSDKGKSWNFEQLTCDPENDNLRPVVPRNKPENIGECVLWFRGDYKSYEEYDCEIVGYVTEK